LLVHAQGGRRLVAAMDHAVFAARIFSVAIAVPIGIFHQPTKRLMMLIGDQVARAFPSLDVAGGIPPSRARQLPLAAEEFEIHRRRRHAVLLQELLGFLELGSDVLARQEDYS